MQRDVRLYVRPEVGAAGCTARCTYVRRYIRQEVGAARCTAVCTVGGRCSKMYCTMYDGRLVQQDVRRYVRWEVGAARYTAVCTVVGCKDRSTAGIS